MCRGCYGGNTAATLSRSATAAASSGLWLRTVELPCLACGKCWVLLCEVISAILVGSIFLGLIFVRASMVVPQKEQLLCIWD